MMYRLSVSPPAHRGPRMVARPPTERRTPWLKPAVEKNDSQTKMFEKRIETQIIVTGFH